MTEEEIIERISKLLKESKWIDVYDLKDHWKMELVKEAIELGTEMAILNDTAFVPMNGPEEKEDLQKRVEEHKAEILKNITSKHLEEDDLNLFYAIAHLGVEFTKTVFGSGDFEPLSYKEGDVKVTIERVKDEH